MYAVILKREQLFIFDRVGNNSVHFIFSEVRKADMEKEMTSDQFMAARSLSIRAAQDRYLSEERDNAGERLSKQLKLPDERFPFQCSCGVKHQFHYIQNSEGAVLQVELPPEEAPSKGQ